MGGLLYNFSKKKYMNKKNILERLSNYEILEYDFRGGNLNDLLLLKDQNEKKYVLQIAKKDRPVEEYLAEFFEIVGVGCNYKYRSLEEQVEFSKICLKKGLPVPSIFEHDSTFIVREFIEGLTYSEFLSKSEDSSIIIKYLKEIIKFHKKGIVMGDRWGPNEVITTGGKFYFFDFDIKLLTKDSKEFEIAHSIYCSIVNAKNKEYAFCLLVEFFENKFPSYYDLSKTLHFFQKHITFYKNRNKHHETNEIIERLARNVQANKLINY